VTRELPSSGAQRAARPTASTLWRDAIDRCERVSAVTAKVRCYGQVFEMGIELEGRYWQLNRGGRTQIRYELSCLDEVHGEDRPATRMLQISDGRFLWEIEEQGGKRSVGRTDLRQLQEHPWPDKMAALRLGTGGLPKVMAALSGDLDWNEPTPHELDGIAVWRLSGSWKAHRASRLSHGQPNVDQWPPHIPDQIQIMLGRDDLVPYRIDYRRAGQSLLVLELFEVATPGFLDEELFHWLTAEPQIEDRTDALRQRLEAAQRR
jgi:hypothetical protein